MKTERNKKVIDKTQISKKTTLCKNCELIQEKQKKIQVDLDKRSLADMENLRKRHHEEITFLLKFANQDLIIDFLSNVDTLKLALQFKNPGPETQKFLIGIKMAYQKMHKTLKNFDVKEISTQTGDVYNADFHETIGSEWNHNFSENTILKIKRSGFTLHDRVIRPVQVIINQKKTAKKN